jgi:hypothetical protein
MQKHILIIFINVYTGIFLSCNNAPDSPVSIKDKENINNVSADANDGDQWISLFDGKSLAGWHGFNRTGEVKNWKIENGELVCLGAAEEDYGGDIVTDRSFSDFELTWDWKLEAGGNTGMMYHVLEGNKYKAPYETGPEYQLSDDAAFADEPGDPTQEAGADYGMHAANDKKNAKPAGEWNTSKIVFNKGHAEHWLNGMKIVEFEAWSASWNQKVSSGKWKDYPDYGKSKTGLISLQDHGKKAYFKNIRIREL